MPDFLYIRALTGFRTWPAPFSLPHCTSRGEPDSSTVFYAKLTCRTRLSRSRYGAPPHNVRSVRARTIVVPWRYAAFWSAGLLFIHLIAGVDSQVGVRNTIVR